MCQKSHPLPSQQFWKKKHVPLSAKNPQTIPNFQSAPVHGPVAPSSFSLMSSAFELIRWGPKAGLVPCNVPWWDLVVSPPGFPGFGKRGTKSSRVSACLLQAPLYPPSCSKNTFQDRRVRHTTIDHQAQHAVGMCAHAQGNHGLGHNLQIWKTPHLSDLTGGIAHHLKPPIVYTAFIRGASLRAEGKWINMWFMTLMKRDVRFPPFSSAIVTPSPSILFPCDTPNVWGTQWDQINCIFNLYRNKWSTQLGPSLPSAYVNHLHPLKGDPQTEPPKHPFRSRKPPPSSPHFPLPWAS